MTRILSSADPRARAREVAEKRASGAQVNIRDLPADAQMVHVLGVDYVHTVTENGGDLYLTGEGFAHAEQLQPDNWYDLKWFRAHREVLEGTGAVYASPTKPINGESLALVVKFSRVGQRVPIDTQLIRDLLSCEFNGPFEEFALVEELRHSRRGPEGLQFTIQTPLAIYVPPDKWQPSQTGRFQWRIANKVAKHPGLAIDILRDYIMVYRWLPGIDACQAEDMGWLAHDDVVGLNERAIDEISAKGYSVLDMKPNHVIVDAADRDHLVTRDGVIQWGLIDFELMERTPEFEREIMDGKRRLYQRRLQELADVSEDLEAPVAAIPEHLEAARVLGIDYLYGHVESTGGVLWVAGNDPALFDFFLPERWRTTPQIRLFENHETYLTTSKDNIRLVWKVSRVGEHPESAALGPSGFRLLAHGFNSPFEEVALARWLRRNGVKTILARAIYRTGHRSQLKESLFDTSRYLSHGELRSPDDGPILETGRNYVTIWDQWDGPIVTSEDEDAPVYRSINLAQAAHRKLLNLGESEALTDRLIARLAELGIDVLQVRPENLLLSIGPDGSLMRDENGDLDYRLCNFQFLRWNNPPDEIKV
jgi:hypothetical protein